MAFRTLTDEDLSIQDNAIRGTNEDAITSKLSAVNAGYIQDEYVKYFHKRPVKRSPLINRGSYVRNKGLDTLIIKFLEIEDGRKQIISLGAGFDTRYFNLKSSLRKFYKYFEIDFPEITAKKVAIIRKNKTLSEIIGDDARIGRGDTEIYGSDYCLLSGDLRDFIEDLIPRLESNGFDRSLSTLFLSECVMIYMDPTNSNKIVEWIGANPDLESQKDRYLSRGWTHAEAVDMNEIYDLYIDPKEHARISRLEMLDELEEWRLLASHYCIAWSDHSIKITGD